MNRIDHQEKAGGGRFVSETPHGAAELVYETGADGELILLHTYVPPAARGRNLARALVEKAVETARQKSVKVDPECSYAARLFERHAEWADLRA
jgi:predicted GNAT family acetyltransferase